MGRLIDADVFRNKLVEMTNDPFASTNRPLNWSHAYESVMVELDRMPNAQGWISVEDRLPEPDECVLAYTVFGERHIFSSDEDADSYDERGRYYSSGKHREVTHWMHLPNPPKEE